MRAGEFADGSRTLRAKIDMASPNIIMRDPLMYRIVHAEHHRTGSKWCIYPTYDWAHGQSDSIEKITHSLPPALQSAMLVLTVCTKYTREPRPSYNSCTRSNQDHTGSKPLVSVPQSTQRLNLAVLLFRFKHIGSFRHQSTYWNSLEPGLTDPSANHPAQYRQVSCGGWCRFRDLSQRRRSPVAMPRIRYSGPGAPGY